MAKPPHTSSEGEPHDAGSISKSGADQFHEKHKYWFDKHNRTVEEFGVFGEEYRPW